MNQIHTNNIPTQGIQRHCEAQTSFIDALTQILQTSIPGANLCQTSLPQCEKISLWLLNANYPQWELNNEQAAHIMGQPPFWSFCWASGQVLAAHLLSNPNHVKNKTVVDFGAGSGVVGIAAKLAGASRVIACDSDPAARIACQANAQLNDVALEVVDSFDAAPAADIITIADVFYDRDNLPMLEAMQKKYNTLWVADSRLKGQTLPGLSIAGCAESFTVPDLSESSEFNHVNIYTSAV